MNAERYKKDIEKLIKEGELLYACLLLEHTEDKEFKKECKKKLEEAKKEAPRFSEKYQSWYSEALEVLRQILPSRVDDFVSYYRPANNRKKDAITYENYTIFDCLNGLHITLGFTKEKVVGPDAAIPKFRQQLKIIESLQKRFESSLFNIRALLQADLFDNELDAAEELRKKGFLRAAGALGGVVLEAHLKEICTKHGMVIKKAKPTIADFNDALKDANVIDIPVWRSIQFLTDIRNICDHKKGREPKEQEIEDLISGIRKVSKKVF